MNREIIVSEIADKTGITKYVVRDIVERYESSIISAVKSGDNVNLYGFGRFYQVERAERTARNPKNGETITIPHRTVNKFSFGKSWKKKADE